MNIFLLAVQMPMLLWKVFIPRLNPNFFDLKSFNSKEEFFRKAQVYQYFYNFVRPNFSKKGKTPLQIVLEDYPGISPKVLNFPVYDLGALFRQKMELPGDQYVPKLPVLIFLKEISCLKNHLTHLNIT